MTDEDLRALFEAAAVEARRQSAEMKLLSAEMNRQFAEVHHRIEDNAAKTNDQFAEVHRKIEDSAAKTNDQFAEVHRKIEESAAETRRHFDITAEGLRHEVGLVAESVLVLDERLTRELADIRGE